MKPYIKLLILTSIIPINSSCFLFDQDNDVSLGQVKIESIIAYDTCGPGVSAGETVLSYEIELRRSGDTLTWLGPSGTVEGVFIDDNNFCIERTQQWHVRDPDPWLEDPGCEMVRLERLCATLHFDSSSDDETLDGVQLVEALEGRHETFYSEDIGYNCSDQLGLAEGQYLALPCQVSHDILGSGTDE